MACRTSETFWCISISWNSISELSCSCCYLKHHDRLIEPSGAVNPAMNVISREFNPFDFILLEDSGLEIRSLMKQNYCNRKKRKENDLLLVSTTLNLYSFKSRYPSTAQLQIMLIRCIIAEVI